MKKKLAAGLATVLFMFGIVGVSGAATYEISYTDTWTGTGTNTSSLIYEKLIDPSAEWFSSALGTLNSVIFTLDADLSLESSTAGIPTAGFSSEFHAENFDGYSGRNIGVSVGSIWGDGSHPFHFTNTVEEDELHKFIDRDVTTFQFQVWADEGLWVSGIASSSLVFDYTPASVPVPEPASILLLGIGIAGFASTRFQKKKK